MVKQEGNKRFRIILTQGLNRQIRRMCEYFGYKVVKLTRVRIMNVTLGSLATGKWRYLSAAEVDTLEQMVSTSSKTAEPAVKQPRKDVPKKQVREDKTPVPKKAAPKETKSAKPKTSSYKDWKKKR
jgi:23S rRNA pseudouridine2604 synthase